MSDQSSEKLNNAIVQLANIYNGRIIIVNENLKIIKDTYALKEKKTLISEKVIKCFNGERQSYYDKDSQFIEVTIPISDTNTKKILGVMTASIPTTNILYEIEDINGKARILIITLIVFVITAAYFLAGIFVKPLKKITSSFEKVSV